MRRKAPPPRRPLPVPRGRRIDGFLDPLVVLPILFAATVLMRLHTYSEPLERDITTYAVIGHEWLKGRLLYSDLWDHKPPAIHLTFALGELLFGYGPFQILMLNLFAAGATLWALYRIGRAYHPAAGNWAALFWVLLSGDLYLQGNQPNVEVFLNATLTWVFALWIEEEKGPSRAWRWPAMGSLVALASLYKHIGIVYGILFLACHFFLRKEKGQWLSEVRRASPLFLFPSLAWALMGIYFWAVGRWDDMFYALFTYNRNYSLSILGKLGPLLGQWHQHGFDPAFLKEGMTWLLAPIAAHNPYPSLAPLFLCLLIPAGIALRVQARSRALIWAPWVTFLVSAEAALLLPENFHPHYYQLLLTPLIAGGAWGTAWVGEKLSKRGPWGTWALGAFLLLLFLGREIPYYKLSPEEWSVRKYGSNIFGDSYRLGKELDRYLGPGETFYQIGNESGLYFASHRSPPAGVFYCYPITFYPNDNGLIEKVVRDLERNRPRFVLISRAYLSPGLMKHPLLLWTFQNYGVEGRMLYGNLILESKIGPARSAH